MKKPDFTQVNPKFLRMMAVVLTRGNDSHNNDIIPRYKNNERENKASLLRHVNELELGVTEDDDDASIAQEAKIACRAMMAWEIRTYKEAGEVSSAADECSNLETSEATLGPVEETWDPFEPEFCPFCGYSHKNEWC